MRSHNGEQGNAMDEYSDMYGRVYMDGTTREQIAEMNFPVQCVCGGVYDLGMVTVTQRYADCSAWKTPCCKRTTDDRPSGWNSGPSYTDLREHRRG